MSSSKRSDKRSESALDTNFGKVAMPKKSILRKNAAAPNLKIGQPTLASQSTTGKLDAAEDLSNAASVSNSSTAGPVPPLQRNPSIGSNFKNVISVPSWVSRLPSSAQLLIGTAVDHMSSMRRVNAANNTPFIDEEDMFLSDEESSTPLKPLPPNIASSTQSSQMPSPTLPPLSQLAKPLTAPDSGAVGPITQHHLLTGGWYGGSVESRLLKRVRFNFKDSVHTIGGEGSESLQKDQASIEQAPNADLPPSSTQDAVNSASATINAGVSDGGAPSEKTIDVQDGALKVSKDEEDEFPFEDAMLTFSEENLHWTPDGKDKHPRIIYSISNEQLNSQGAESAIARQEDTGDSNEMATLLSAMLNGTQTGQETHSSHVSFAGSGVAVRATLDDKNDGENVLSSSSLNEDEDEDEDDNDVLELKSFLFDPNDMPDQWRDLDLSSGTEYQRQNLTGEGKAKGDANDEKDAFIVKAQSDTSASALDAKDSESLDPYYSIEEVYQIYIRDLERRRDKGLQSVIDSMNVAFRQNTNLLYLDLKGDPVSRRSIGSICDLLQMHSGLSTLLLEQCNLEDDFLKLLLNSLLLEDTVETLSLARNAKLKTPGAKYIAIYLRKSRSIASLDLSYIPFDGKGIAYIGHGLYEEVVRTLPAQNVVHRIHLVSNLKVLRMDGVALRRNTTNAFAISGAVSGNVTYKGSGSNRLGWDSLFRKIPKSNLRHLSLSNCRLREILGNWGPEMLRSWEFPAPTIAPEQSLGELNHGTRRSLAQTGSSHESLGEGSSEQIKRSKSCDSSNVSLLETNLATVDKPSSLFLRDSGKLQVLRRQGIAENEATRLLPLELGQSRGASLGLHGLNLSRNPLGSVDLILVSLAQGITLNNSLRYLVLQGCLLGEKTESLHHDKGFAALLESIKASQSIEYLDLSENKLQSRFSVITDMIGGNKSIRHLCLRACDLSSENMIALAESLALSDTLRKIDLRGNKGALDVASLMALNASLKLNKSIVSLELDYGSTDSSLNASKASSAPSDSGEDRETKAQVVQLFLQELQAITSRNLTMLKLEEQAMIQAHLDEDMRVATFPGVLISGASGDPAEKLSDSGKRSGEGDITAVSTPLSLLPNRPGTGSSSMLASQASAGLELSEIDLDRSLSSTSKIGSPILQSVNNSSLDLSRRASITRRSGETLNQATAAVKVSTTPGETEKVVKSESVAKQTERIPVQNGPSPGPSTAKADTSSKPGNSLAERLREIYQVPAPSLCEDETGCAGNSMTNLDGLVRFQDTGASDSLHKNEAELFGTDVFTSATLVHPSVQSKPPMLSRKGSSSSDLSSPVSFSSSGTQSPVLGLESNLGETPRQLADLAKNVRHILRATQQVEMSGSFPQSAADASFTSQSKSLQGSTLLDPLLEHFSIDDA